MYPGPNGPDRVNCFALVSYIPEPISGFLDRLRQELVPNCFLRAHVTILPPRPISSSTEAAWTCIQELALQFKPFEVELTGVEIFPVSDVIYVAVGAGGERLREMHAVMNTNGLAFQETHSYQPHVTLAQDLKPDQMDELIRVARQRWTEFAHGRKFCVDKIVFVQNRRKEWIDLGECSLGQDECQLAGVPCVHGS